MTTPTPPTFSPTRSHSPLSARSDSRFAPASIPIRVRIGLHTGDALQEADQFFGTTVHYAARVASHALAGEILVSSVVRDLVSGGPDVVFLEEREVQLKGLDGLHRLFAVNLQ